MLQPELYGALCTAAKQGRVVFIGGGPNCRTWSILRHIPKPGPLSPSPPLPLSLSPSLPLSLSPSLPLSLSPSLPLGSESTLKARLGYLERYFAWCSDHKLPWVPLTVSATWKWMQALKGASPSAPTSGYQSLRWFAHIPLLKGSATHSLQAAPPLRQKPAILVSQVKRLELLTDSDEPALVNIVGGILVALYSRSRWLDLQRASSLELDAPEGVTYFGNTFYQLNTSEYKTSKSGGKSRLILPLTLPIFSLSGCHWFQNWLTARDRLGLPVQGAIAPLIRSVGAQGDTPRPFNTSEVNSRTLP